MVFLFPQLLPDLLGVSTLWFLFQISNIRCWLIFEDEWVTDSFYGTTYESRFENINKIHLQIESQIAEALHLHHLRDLLLSY